MCTSLPLLFHSLIATGAGGHPCTQCIERGVRCEVAGSRRRKRRDDQHSTVAERLSRIEDIIQKSTKPTNIPREVPEQLTTPTATASPPTLTPQSRHHQESLHASEKYSSQPEFSSVVETTTPEQLDIWHPRKQAITIDNDVLRNLTPDKDHSLDAVGAFRPGRNPVVLDNGAIEQQSEFQSTQVGEQVAPVAHERNSELSPIRDDGADASLETVSTAKLHWMDIAKLGLLRYLGSTLVSCCTSLEDSVDMLTPFKVLGLSCPFAPNLE